MKKRYLCNFLINNFIYKILIYEKLLRWRSQHLYNKNFENSFTIVK